MIFQDQLGRSLELPQPPQRIISLVPSQTELLFDLGLAERIVGRTKFCVHPAEQIAQIPSVGGTKKFRFDVIEQLQPDLILGNKEENYEEGITRLATRYPVWLSDVKTLEDGLAMIEAVGALTRTSEKTAVLTTKIQAQFDALQPLQRPFRVAYLIWQKPYMTVGGDTFINDMLSRCGFSNLFAARADSRYPQISLAELQAANLDALLLSSEPFPFGEKHQLELAKLLPKTAVHLVDGELFSWYGSRLVKTAVYLADLIQQLS